MLRYRKAMLLVAVAAVAGSLSGTVGYGLHLRSDQYRGSLESRLSDRLGMPLSLGSVAPLSLRSRVLEGVRVRSSRRDAEVFGCARAVWRNELRDDGPSCELDLEDGWLLVGSREWGRDDYRQMLRTGLGHDFAGLGIRRIGLTDIDLKWKHPRMTWTAARSRGRIVFDAEGTGRATLVAGRLNGSAMERSIEIAARFTPGSEVRFHDVELSIPEAPLNVLRLDGLVGGAVSRGVFQGSVNYRHRDDGAVVSVAGAVRDALLSELTGALDGGAYAGRVDVVVDEATFDAGGLRTLRFSGSLDELEPGRFLPMSSSGAMSGRLDLRVHQAVYREGRIDYFSAEGRATGVSLGPLTELIGGGRVTGTLDVEIHSLLIVDDHVILAEVTLDAIPPAGEAGVIDRALIGEVSARALGVDVTGFLPPSIEHVEYTRAGARLALNRDELRVRGTHGEESRTILTVKLMGREVGVVKEPATVYHVDDLVGLAREHLGRIGAEQLREWLLGSRSGDDQRE